MKSLFKKGPFLLMILLFVLIFFPVLFQNRQFGFRDESFFYFPLFQYIQSYWNRGEIPLWDPSENLGLPLIANPTSSVFYPLKLIFFLPFNYHLLFSWYIMIHVPWAFFGMFCLARFWKFSKTAAFISAFSYAFSAVLIFQYSNPIYLIGPSWIPWGILTGDQLMRKRSRTAFFGLSLVLAMTILGGEPQSGYFIGLILLTLCFFYWKNGLFKNKSEPSFQAEIPGPSKISPVSRISQILRAPISLLIGSALFAVGLSAVQVLPTLEFVQASNRTQTDTPSSVWDLPSALIRNSQVSGSVINIRNSDSPQQISSPCPDRFSCLQRILCKDLQTDPQSASVYNFSIPPLYGVSFFWPNFCGSLFPYNIRWGSGAPDDRIWTLSLYMGLIPFLLALSVFKIGFRSFLHRQNKTAPCKRTPNSFGFRSLRTPFSLLALIFLLGSTGGYGLIWIWRCFSVWSGCSQNSLAVSNYDPIGGIYWLFQTFLPFFSFFRYPGKLLAPAIFSLAVLAGLGWDLHRRNSSLKFFTLFFFILSISGLFIVYFSGSNPFRQITLGNQAFFGEFQPDLAWKMVLSSMTQTAIISGIFFLLLFFEKKRSSLFQKSEDLSINKPLKTRILKFIPPQYLGGIILILISLDLFLADRSLIGTVPRSVYERNSVCSEIVQRTAEKQNADSDQKHEKIIESPLPPVRIYRMNNWFPQSLVERSSPNRLAERLFWERSTLAPRYHLTENIASLNVYGTMSFSDYDQFDRELLRTWRKNFIPILQFLDVSFLLGPQSFIDSVEDLANTDQRSNTNRSNDRKTLISFENFLFGNFDSPDTSKFSKKFLETNSSLPEKEFRLPIDTQIALIQKHSGRIKTAHDRDLVLNPEQSIFSLDLKKIFETDLGESAELTEYQPQKISFNICLKRSAEVLLLEQYDKNWKVTVYGKNGKVFFPELHQALRLFRSITLPEGNFHVVMTYQPTSFFLGISVSVIFLLILCFFYTFLLKKFFKAKQPSGPR